MASEPKTNVTDQRYYHVALLVPRTSAFGLAELRRLVTSEFGASRARLTAPSSDDKCRVTTLCVHASDEFAGSEEARLAMAIPKKDGCAYDAFLGEVVLVEPARRGGPGGSSLLILGTSYAGLTRHICRVLAKKTKLLDHALFGVPDLDGIVELCRRRAKGTEVILTLTGLGILRPGGKFVSGLRLTGKNVLAGGLLEAVESWMVGADDDSGEPRSQQNTRKKFLIPQNVRLRSERPEGASLVTLTLAQDGSVKMWMRSHGASLLAFITALRVIGSKRLLSASAEQPKWAEEREF